MFIGISIFLVLMAMGGIIAFLGDKIGSKVGKKRMTLFGLRPKYTSIIVTIISGTLISCLTIVALAVVNENVRVALFGLSKLHAEMDQLNTEIASKNKALDEGKLLLDQRNTEVETMNRKTQNISQELSQVESQRNYMQSQLSVVQDAYAKAQADVESSAEDIRQLEETRQELSSNIDKLNEEKKALIGNIEAIREGTVIFRAGQVLTSAVVDANMSDETASQVLASILNDINSALRERLNIQNKDAIVVRVPRTEFADAAQKIAHSPVKKLVRVTAAGNIILGESTVVDFDIHDNVQIYKEGDVVYSVDISTYKNFKNQDIKVLQFLKDVNHEATSKGVLPDPITGNVGQLDTREMLDVIQRVKELGGRCRLTAYAKHDTYTAGPVVIDVKVDPK